MGIYGLLDPTAQLRMMGFLSPAVRAPEDHTATVMTIVGFATLNTAALYLVGSIKEWPGFFALAIWTRLVMGAGLMLVTVNGQAPDTFISAAVWEWMGAAFIAVACAWDVRGRRTSGRCYAWCIVNTIMSSVCREKGSLRW
ncbi:TPA: hypothetical protein ACPZJB_000653 [Yersinia enterocolitica]